MPIRPERICHELTQHVPDDGIVVVDTGHAGMWMGGMYDLTIPKQSYMRSAGHLGWAFPAGLGAKCAVPEPPGGDVHRRRRLLVPHRRDRDRGALEDQRGDGGQQQFERQPVEARLRPRLWRQADRAGAELWTFTKVNFARIAEDMGAVGIRVEKPGELGPAIEQALKADRPVIIDVVTDIDALAPLAVS